MESARRNFLKTAGAAAAGAPLLAPHPAPARAAAREGDPDLPRGLTLATVRRHDQWRQVWLKAGDRIRCGVEPLGTLEIPLA